MEYVIIFFAGAFSSLFLKMVYYSLVMILKKKRICRPCRKHEQNILHVELLVVVFPFRPPLQMATDRIQNDFLTISDTSLMSV